MEIAALVICVLLSLQSVLSNAPCHQSPKGTNYETSTDQQPELPEIREAG